jgi:hypothetical protein
VTVTGGVSLGWEIVFVFCLFLGTTHSHHIDPNGASGEVVDLDGADSTWGGFGLAYLKGGYGYRESVSERERECVCV